MEDTLSSRLRWLFFGPHGLRAGWSIYLFVAIVRIMARTIMLFRQMPPAPKGPEDVIKMMLTAEAVSGFVVLVASWVMSKIERRPLGQYGFGDRHKVRHFLQGTALGIGSLSVLVSILWATGHLAFGPIALGARAALGWGLVSVVVFLLVAFLEEYFMRGFLQFTLARGIAGVLTWLGRGAQSRAAGFWTAALILSFLFGYGHLNNPGESPLGLVNAGLAGLLFCVALWRTGSLWWPLGFHLSWNWAQTFLFGTANSGTRPPFHLLTTGPVGRTLLSGGSTGPEGSILIVPLLLAVAVIFLRGKPEWQESREA